MLPGVNTCCKLLDTIKSLPTYINDIFVLCNIPENYKKMTALRAQYPHLNILLSIGGYNEGSKKYSDLVSLPERRSTFVRSVVDFLKYGIKH